MAKILLSKEKTKRFWSFLKIIPYLCIMKRILLAFLLAHVAFLTCPAQDDLLEAKRAVRSDGYAFWVYTPQDYRQYERTTPLILFLHGASLRGNDLDRVLHYGPLDAVRKGLQIPAIIVAPQNPKGHWDPRKLYDILEWMQQHYTYNPQRVYVLGMSLGGYGTLDFAGAYPDKIAAAIALCGGSTLKNYSGLGKLPLWIIHGTADKAVKVEESKKVVEAMQRQHADGRLRYDWLKGASHGDLARYFYLTDTYDWLFQHTLIEPYRPVDTNVIITPDEKAAAYQQIRKRSSELRIR